MNPTIMALAGSASLLPAAIGVFRFAKLSSAMKAYALLCVLSSLEIAAEFTFAFYHHNGIIVSNIALGVETIFITAVYAIAFNIKIVRGTMLALGATFALIWVPGSIVIQDPGQFNQAMAIASRIFILVTSVIALYTVATRTAASLTDESLFWITTGNILYASGLIFLLAVSNDLLALSPPYYTAAWDLNWSLIILADVLFAKGLMCRSTSQT